MIVACSYVSQDMAAGNFVPPPPGLHASKKPGYYRVISREHMQCFSLPAALEKTGVSDSNLM